MPQDRSEEKEPAGIDAGAVRSAGPIRRSKAAGDESSAEYVSMLSPKGRQETLDECEALVIYVGRHGDVMSDDEGHKEAYAKLLHLVSGCNGRPPDTETWPALVQAYAAVTRFTQEARGVSGRSVLDSWHERRRKRRGRWNLLGWLVLPLRPTPAQRPLAAAVWLSALALALHAFTSWSGRIAEPEALGTVSRLVYYGLGDGLALLLPANCGAIGSCVFLLKQHSDRLSALAYEADRPSGDAMRIFLGAVFGVLAVSLVFPGFGEAALSGEVTFGPIAAAFLAGFGVEPAYTRLQRMVQRRRGFIAVPGSSLVRRAFRRVFRRGESER